VSVKKLQCKRNQIALISLDLALDLVGTCEWTFNCYKGKKIRLTLWHFCNCKDIKIIYWVQIKKISSTLATIKNNKNWADKAEKSFISIEVQITAQVLRRGLRRDLHRGRPHCNPLQGKYRFFTGISLWSNSTLTCFGSVQGLKGQISLKYREIYAFYTGISILYIHSCLCSYNRDFPALWKTTTWNFAKTGKTL
jgi:hypothetical protein